MRISVSCASLTSSSCMVARLWMRRLPRLSPVARCRPHGDTRRQRSATDVGAARAPGGGRHASGAKRRLPALAAAAAAPSFAGGTV